MQPPNLFPPPFPLGNHKFIFYVYDSISIWGHISGKSHNSKIYMHPNIHCNTIYKSQDMEAT